MKNKEASQLHSLSEEGLCEEPQKLSLDSVSHRCCSLLLSFCISPKQQSGGSPISSPSVPAFRVSYCRSALVTWRPGSGGLPGVRRNQAQLPNQGSRHAPGPCRTPLPA